VEAVSANGTTPYDVVIVGAGVVGCAIARALSRFELRVALLDGNDDVGAGTSKANSAILHTGFDAPVDTLEADLVSRGHRLLASYGSEVGIPIDRVGALVVAWSPSDVDELSAIAGRARQNGYQRGTILSAEETYQRLPALARGALGAFSVPDESIICPFTTSIALAADAVENGVELNLGSRVTNLTLKSAFEWAVECENRTLSTRWVVNAAGLHSDEVEAMLGNTEHKVTPRRGEFVLFDKTAGSLAPSIVLPVPTARSKGVLLAPTVFGNLLLGPTAEDVHDKGDTRTTDFGIAQLIARGERVMPGIGQHEITSTYAGLRAVGPVGYEVDADGDTGYVWAYGIRSTGLTASMAIAEHLVDRMAGAGLATSRRLTPAQRPRGLNFLGENGVRRFDTVGGRVMCFCENTTLEDLESALTSTIPPRSLDGLWRRTRAMGGRCQGFNCRPEVTAWFEHMVEGMQH